MSLRTLINWTGRQPQAEASSLPPCNVSRAHVVAAVSGGAYPEIVSESLSDPCGASPVVMAWFTCPCGHGGSRTSCAAHAEPGPDQLCGYCREQYGHICPVTITTAPL